MTSAIYWLMDDYGISWSKIMAYATLVSMPVVILFIIAQKYIISGMTAGSVKG
jgi:ABC-type maltose transport system permease subunit